MQSSCITVLISNFNFDINNLAGGIKLAIQYLFISQFLYFV